MRIYVEWVALLNFGVDFLLLMATNRLTGHPNRTGRLLLGAGFGGIYGGICLFPRLYFLGNTLWRTVALGIMAVLAFGCSKSALRRGVVFALLSMALGGVALGLGGGGVWKLLLAAVVLCLLCGVGFHSPLGAAAYVPVELRYGDTRLRLTALRDTGNTLRDPVTGRPVLVVGADVAGKLLGLTPEQLRKPVESMGLLPGLRLIPYRALGQPGGLLLALRLKDVKIGEWQGSGLVAFAPQGLSPEGAYQALTGGSQ